MKAKVGNIMFSFIIVAVIMLSLQTIETLTRSVSMMTFI